MAGEQDHEVPRLESLFDFQYAPALAPPMSMEHQKALANGGQFLSNTDNDAGGVYPFDLSFQQQQQIAQIPQNVKATRATLKAGTATIAPPKPPSKGRGAAAKKRKQEELEEEEEDDEDDEDGDDDKEMRPQDVARMKYNHIEDDKERKRLKRLLRNRVSAQQARERKKAYMNNLEGKSKEQEHMVAQLQMRVQTLERENFMLRNIVKNNMNRDPSEALRDKS